MHGMNKEVNPNILKARIAFIFWVKPLLFQTDSLKFIINYNYFE